MSLLLPRIIHSLDLMLPDYKAGAKSKHWEMFFTDKMVETLHDAIELRNFRANSLTDDIDAGASWFSTAASYMRLARLTGPEWIAAYAETSVGNPKTYRFGGTDVNFMELSLLHYLWTISQHFKGGTIVGIGAGYGGLPHKIKHRFPLAHYVLLDLPEALTLQSYYLSKLNPDAKFYFYDDYVSGVPLEPEKYDFTLLPGWLADKIPGDSVDLFINTRSFMEMNKDVIAEYFRQIARCLKVGGHLYNVNRYMKGTVGEPIRFKEYPYNGGWDIKVSRPSFFQSHVHEMMTVRTNKPLTNLKAELSKLPEDAPLQKPSQKHSFGQMLSLLPLMMKR